MRLNDLPKAMQLVTGRSRILSQGLCAFNHSPFNTSWPPHENIFTSDAANKGILGLIRWKFWKDGSLKKFHKQL